ncbi:MAG TPA: tetratricopeptide repeat protein [Candidatus Omnitrophota bacterium]|nr:tetratricopeptide repeat protein [Candidatus Omnitrophota bacterium]HPS37310.1 tetratricopeptide repeat protein [Candidatus Omnitrophota bacterium]
MTKKILGCVLVLGMLFPSPVLVRAAVPEREIRIGVAVTPEFKAIPNWRSEFDRRLSYASRIFQGEFKIKFVPYRWYDWTGIRESDEPRILLENLMAQYPLKDVDIMIGLTHVPRESKDPIGDVDTIGQARPLSGYLVLRYPMNRLYKIQEETTLVHEMGHLFGATHTEDPSSIMYPIIAQQLPSRFDQENREIIMETRTIDFKRGVTGLPRSAVQRLIGSYLKMIVQDQPFDFYYMLGVLYISLAQYDDALGAWKKAVSILPDYARIHYDIGMLYFRLGSQDEAVRELSRAVQGFRYASQKKDKLLALNAMGDVFLAQQNDPAAYNAYTRALALDPGSRNIRLNLAIIQMRKGQYENAIREFENLLYQDPNNPKILVNMGTALLKSGRYQESERYLQRALEATQNKAEMAEIHTSLAKMYYRSQQPKLALDQFKAACSIAASVDCMKGMAQMHYELQQWDECISALATVLQVQRDDPDVYGTIAVAMIQKGMYDQALPLLREGLQYAKDNVSQARFYKNIGNVMIQLKRYDLAEKEFQVAVSKDWNNVETHMGLAVSYIGTQNLLGAKKELQDALRIDPQNAKAKELLETVNKILNQTTRMDLQIKGK